MTGNHIMRVPGFFIPLAGAHHSNHTRLDQEQIFPDSCRLYRMDVVLR